MEVAAADRRQLEGWLRSHSTPQALARRARIVLDSADGESIRQTEQAIRHGSFDSVRRPEAAINRWLAHWNENARPFRWTRSAADIKRSLNYAALIYATRH